VPGTFQGQRDRLARGDGLENHWALPAGVRIPSLSFSVGLRPAGLKSLRLEPFWSQRSELRFLTRPLHVPMHPYVHASVRPWGLGLATADAFFTQSLAAKVNLLFSVSL
jgi:hypothetical protein